ncbi:hypothetical protein JVT61DRAFT_4128 [Boletus reticuloceps]|uniref:Uncharacterized protein n=1 Tax=Boletus reticuloceps TaxID=495285 RepID=A0A8I2YPQ2_9AGAM|nr:hypothetical protein JVT61DRAFT_4128 [Boletus reticuloceps]
MGNEQQIIFVSLASSTALVLVPFIIGKSPSKERLPMISGTSVLGSLWLEAHSEALHSRLNTIEDPRSDRSRAAGMFDVALEIVGIRVWRPRRRLTWMTHERGVRVSGWQTGSRFTHPF